MVMGRKITFDVDPWCLQMITRMAQQRKSVPACCHITSLQKRTVEDSWY